MADKKSDAKYTPTRGKTLSAQSTEAVPNELGPVVEGQAAEPGQADDDEEAAADDQHTFTSKYTPTRVEIHPGQTFTDTTAAPHRPKPVRRNHDVTVEVTFDPPAKENGKQRVLFTCLDGSDVGSVLRRRHIDIDVTASATVSVVSVTSRPVKVDQNAPLVEVLALAVTDEDHTPSDTMIVT